MKVVIAWSCLVTLAILIAASCSIKHASDQYECEDNADCTELGDNRVCSGGLCVVQGGKQDASMGDAPRTDGMPDASNVCPAQCTQCNLEKKECTIDCSQNPNLCAGQMTCPTGFACFIHCNTASSCRNGINCLTGTSCQIECSGSFACRNISCGPGACDITCGGNNSCSGVSCGTSCACDVKCGANASCFNVVCTKPQCSTGFGCSSQLPTCETCP